VGTTQVNGDIISTSSVVGPNTFSFVATAATTFVMYGKISAGMTSIDNLSFKRTEHDRVTVNPNGLNVIGSLTKAAVAPGAQLVAYSGFSASNYLEQPYSSKLDFGTGDLSIPAWVRIDPAQSALETIWCRDSPTTGKRFKLSVNASGFLVAEVSDGTTTRTAAGTVSVRDGRYHLVEVSYSAGVVAINLDGVSHASATGAALLTLSNAAATFRVGLDAQGANPGTNVAVNMLRPSATVPSADQRVFAFNTERKMFDAGAQITIAGTTTNVNQVDADVYEDSYHAVTSWGRSKFVDLVRVESVASTVGNLVAVASAGGIHLTAGSGSVRIVAPALTMREELRSKFEARRANGRIPVRQDFDSIGFTATTGIGSASLTSVVVTAGTPYVGMGISGSGIPAGATITAINGNVYTISANATANGTAVAIGQTTFAVPRGFSVAAPLGGVLVNRQDQRIGTTKDYVIDFDGFAETVRFAVSPGSGTWVRMVTVRSN
jgi:hypothetical protein